MEAAATDRPFDIVAALTADMGLDRRNVEAVVALLSDKATVPFIARYRKEATGGLDEVQIRTIQERHEYLKELEDRRQTVLRTIEEQGKLTDELRSSILRCTTKRELEDLYLPFKPKRRTRATIAREKGLEPLALRILEQPTAGDPEEEALLFVDEEKGVEDVGEALKGACDIVTETVAETAEVRALVRGVFAEQGVLRTVAVPEHTAERTKFEDYYDYHEPVQKIPSHRYLAICRGESEQILKVGIEVDGETLIRRIQDAVGHKPDSPFGPLLVRAVKDAYKRRLFPAAENDVRSDLKARSDGKAVEIFADNLEQLLLQPPLGARPVLGIDPGLRTGSKCAAVSETGKFLEHRTLFTTQGESKKARARQDLLSLVQTHRPEALAVGNGTGGRELVQFVKTMLAEAGLADAVVVQVNEDGASVYSASELARQEFPELDVTIRGAISIARRLQDPLAELVKIEPKSIGVGQYQHDVNQTLLQRKLNEVVESCVNRVGVELNTASASLLSYVAGVGPTLSRKIVAHREAHGPFANRHAVLGVAGFGPKAFEQAAGFLRLTDSDHPLDRSAVHPERYGLVERIASDMGVSLIQLTGSAELADRIDIRRYVGNGVGEPTLKDIIEELKKPGRDPRARFDPPEFRDDIRTMEDLKEGMVLQGAVTNVTAFGAFVDVGVHHDGLVHISQLANRFVKDPRDAVKVGQKITVRVLGVDLERRRISLSARLEEPPTGPTPDSSRRPKPDASRDAKPHSNQDAKLHSNRDAHQNNKNRHRRPGRRGRNAAPGAQDRQPSRRFSNTPFADFLKNRQED